MTDKDLLEMAAKAAGIKLIAWTNMYDACDEIGGRFITMPHGEPWNPLEEDGDALRLAVNLRIDFYEGAGDGPEAWAGYYLHGFTKQKFACVPYGTDPYAATRRAIVLAAAAQGTTKD